MTYKQIVDNIKQIVQDHYQLADFGYGQISDIKNGADDTEADYPYAFLNPGAHTRGERSIIYRFNLIVMDMYLDDEFLQAQSDCQQYIDDILAQLKYNNVELYDININSTLTPFKERFQDVVGGMTATIDIEVPQKLDLCIAPVRPPLQFVLDAESDRVQLFRPDVSQNPQGYQITNVDTYNAMRPGAANFYQIDGYIPSIGDWVFTETGEATKISGTDPFTNPRILVVRALTGVETQILPDTSTFPNDAPLAQPFDYTCTWNIQLDPALIDYVAIQDYDDVATEPIYETSVGTKLTATYQPLS